MNFLASLVRPSSYADVPAEEHEEKSADNVPKIVDSLFEQLDRKDEIIGRTVCEIMKIVDNSADSDVKPKTEGITDAKCGCAANSSVYGNLQHFDGTETPIQARTWLRKLNEAREKNRWTEAFTYEIASNLLENSARNWAEKQNATMKTWGSFKVEFNHKYCNVKKTSISKGSPVSIERICETIGKYDDGCTMSRKTQLHLISSRVCGDHVDYHYFVHGVLPHESIFQIPLPK